MSSLSDLLTIVFKPDRLKYIVETLKNKNAGKDESCVFCEGLKNGKSSDTLFLFESKHSMVFLNKYPYNAGHLLVLPKKHEGELDLLSDDETTDIHELLVLSVKVLKRKFQPQALNIGMNMGKAAGGGIPGHLHYHIIPRWNGDTNFYPIIAKTKVIAGELDTFYSLIRDGFKEVVDGN